MTAITGVHCSRVYKDYQRIQGVLVLQEEENLEDQRIAQLKFSNRAHSKPRWMIERTNVWLGQFRRLLVCYEHLLATYRAFFNLAPLWITLCRCYETRSNTFGLSH
jgi:transposase